MDITKFVVSSRENAFLYGDHSSYRGQLSHKLLKTRKRLHIATKSRAKFQPKAPVTPEQVAENHEFLHLQLLTTERAWAHAMAMKEAHSAEKKGIRGKTRSHIVSRLDKAARAAEHLVEVLSNGASGASKTDVLEARAYAALLRGTAQFESQRWEPCLKNYSLVHVIYNALATSTKGDIYKDLLSETVDPSIRYAAYQLKIPRTQPIAKIALDAFPSSDTSLVESINGINPAVLNPQDEEVNPGAEGAPTTITWRSRQVKIEDAAIAVAWAAVETAKGHLQEKLGASSSSLSRDRAAAYDDILIVSQDAVDATKEAIGELKSEGVPQSDSRMQSLQITNTAVNYEMISWRIGRNRVLTGELDGAKADAGPSPTKRAAKKEALAENTKEETPGRRIARLKEKVVLYEGNLQSIESIKELPGVAADTTFSGQLDATFKYFNALKSLAISRSHAIAGHAANALALAKFALDQCKEAVPVLTTSDDGSSPPNIVVYQSDAQSLHNLLTGEVQRSRALVEISNLRNKSTGASQSASIPLISRLKEYPADGVDLENIVVFPPKLESVPVKPLFLDVAWNYIDYHDKQVKVQQKRKEDGDATASSADAKPQKKGWFGFGR